MKVLLSMYLWSATISFCLYLLESWVSNRRVDRKSIKSCYIYALTPVCNTGYAFLMLMYLIAITIGKAIDKLLVQEDWSNLAQHKEPLLRGFTFW